MINQEVQDYIANLIKFGFKEYTPDKMIDSNERYFQYLVNDRGDKFYVNVRFWQRSKYAWVGNSFDAICYLKTKPGRNFTVNLHDCSRMSPECIIKWFDKMFESMDCKYYYKDESDD